MPMTLKQAKTITGHKSGLGKPSKMPGFSTAIPAKRCNVGGKLRKIKGSVCENCYAFEGNYRYPSVQEGHEKRFQALEHPQWEEGMIRLIGHYTDPSDPFFRIHDGGDLQSLEHLLKWIRIAMALPWIKFWMPSKESRIVKAARAIMGDKWPTNLVVRLSSPMIGKNPPKSFGDALTSTVQAANGFECKAYTRGNRCGPCRACWDPNVQNVDYHVQ